MRSIDLNCDMGESYGAWRLGADEELMPLITSANVACGYHAGDPLTIDRTVRLAMEHGVAVGAHPSYPDLQGFGRRSMKLNPTELYGLVLYQVAAAEGIARANGGTLHHVKLHGAMYNDVATDAELSAATVRALQNLNPDLLLYALAGSVTVEVAGAAGLTVVEEAFADRRYNPDGSLQSRHVAGALVTDPAAAVAQALKIATAGIVTEHDGSGVNLHAGTLCVHGDNPSAPAIARAIRTALEDAGVQVHTPGPIET